MNGVLGRIKEESGFSIGEVVIAMVLFIASILGVSGMLISGGQNVTMGAKDSAAANLAQQKIEEVKSLPFYVPYNTTNGNTDADDFYWSYQGSTPCANDQQRTITDTDKANPKKYEDYNTIPGYVSYRRTTAVVYQYASGMSSMVDATMKTGWVPKSPTGLQTDQPYAFSGDKLHGMLVQVKVCYRMNTGAEKVYTAQGFVGDLMVPGGSNDPALTINSIVPPASGSQSEANHGMTILVTSDGTLNNLSTLDVMLWHEGMADIHCRTGTAHANINGTQITCEFDLRPTNGVTPGKYNLTVLWKDKGFKAVFRDNVFEVITPEPTITGISNHNWGYRELATPRQVTLAGTNLWGSTVAMKGPRGVPEADKYSIDGSVPVVSPDGTTATVTFSMGGNTTTRPRDSRWDFLLTTGGGTAKTDSWGNDSVFKMNPPPRVDNLTNWPDVASAYTGTRHSNIYSNLTVTGAYFQPGCSMAMTRGTQSPAAATTYASLNGSLDADGANLTSASMNVNVNPMTNSFKQWGASGFGGTAQSDNILIAGDYYVYIMNPDTERQTGVSSFTRTVNHAQYSVTATSSPAGWGSVSLNPAQPAGGFYQDTAYTLTPSPLDATYQARVWQEGGDKWSGNDPWGVAYPQNPLPPGGQGMVLSGTAKTAARTLNLRFLKKLYWGSDGASANWAGFHTGYTRNDGGGAGYDAPNYTYADNAKGTTYVMRLHSWCANGIISSKHAEVDAETGSFYNCTPASTIWICWTQPNGSAWNTSNNYAGFSRSGTHNGRYNDGNFLGRNPKDTFGWQWDSASCSTINNHYVRVGAFAEACWGLSSKETDVRVAQMFIE
jgi:hypothetical protein